MAQGSQAQAMDLYMRRMHRVIMILAPFFCLAAGILFSSYKAVGFYPDVPMAPLNNRKAYYLATESIDHPERLGVVFADVNGLKYTNDNFGHLAGDNRIINFAHMLTDNFRNREIFRISGNEFVVLCQNIDRSMFDQRVRELQEKLATQDEPVATIGSAYGHASLDDAMYAAEKAMYEQKANYYERFPERKR